MRLAMIVWPIQRLVDAPIRAIEWLNQTVTSQEDLLAENATLRAHQLLLQARLQKLLTLEKENAELQNLLQTHHHLGGQAMVGQLLAVDLDPNLNQVVVDKGSRHGVFVGQPVVDAYGVMGQIIDVGPFQSTILLITDPRSAVPVEDYRNGIRAIATGTGDPGYLKLIHVPDTTDIREGDLMVVSNLGVRFPVGYPVGKVLVVAHIPGERFARIIISPVAHLDRSLQVLLLWPESVRNK